MPELKLTWDQVDDMSDDALATIAAEWAVEAKLFADAASLARYELERRLTERAASKLDTENWSGTVRSNGYDYAIADPGALAAALLAAGIDRTRLDTEVYVQPVAPPKRFDHRALNEIAKLGGAYAEAIDRFRTKTPRAKSVELKPKASP